MLNAFKGRGRPVYGIYGVRIKERVNHLILNLEQGKSIIETYAPYAVQNNKYLYPDLFLKTDQGLRIKYITQILKIIADWTLNKKLCSDNKLFAF